MVIRPITAPSSSWLVTPNKRRVAERAPQGSTWARQWGRGRGCSRPRTPADTAATAAGTPRPKPRSPLAFFQHVMVSLAGHVGRLVRITSSWTSSTSQTRYQESRQLSHHYQPAHHQQESHKQQEGHHHQQPHHQREGHHSAQGECPPPYSIESTPVSPRTEISVSFSFLTKCYYLTRMIVIRVITVPYRFEFTGRGDEQREREATGEKQQVGGPRVYYSQLLGHYTIGAG
ncbi:hypothetical protein E2C01_081320 [Portunus trituberculatus]|uniref:Uncharacterized protein n=1 Tax=Portunus trituberculatus TaxID=210409 RepID=A0A5B7IPF8_PORTR|nr:hypothetical protein [Portunus trituberculatus]